MRSSASAANRNLSLIARARRRTTRGSRGPERRVGVDWLWPKRGLASAEAERTRCLALRRGGEAGVDLKRTASSEEDMSGDGEGERKSEASSPSRISASTAPECPNDGAESGAPIVRPSDLAFALRRLRRGCGCCCCCCCRRRCCSCCRPLGGSSEVAL